MTLTDQIEQARENRDALEKDLKDARRLLWDAEFVRKHDARRKGESEQHWKNRRARNRKRAEEREEVVKLLLKKIAFWQSRIDHLHDEKQEAAADGPGVKGSQKIVTFDGKPLVSDLAYWAQKQRNAGWGGIVISGYRTPEYSEQLCYQICGAPSCPGRCAGRSSHHSLTTYPGPAADVSLPWEWEDVSPKTGCPYYNNLPLDLNHMSRSGN